MDTKHEFKLQEFDLLCKNMLVSNKVYLDNAKLRISLSIDSVETDIVRLDNAAQKSNLDKRALGHRAKLVSALAKLEQAAKLLEGIEL